MDQPVPKLDFCPFQKISMMNMICNKWEIAKRNSYFQQTWNQAVIIDLFDVDDKKNKYKITDLMQIFYN